MRRIGESLTEITRRYMPDPFIFAILLTLVVYALGLIFTARGPYGLIQDWYRGFWNLLTFAMQMTLILVTGFALASAGPVQRALRWLARQPRSAPGAVGLVALVAAILGWLNWGLGLIAGALLAREMAAAGRRRGLKIHYPLAAAAGYAGLVIWHGGLSASAPLLVNTKGHFLEGAIGLIPLTETIFRPFNLVLVVAAVIVIPLVLMSMHPKPEDAIEAEPEAHPVLAGGSPAASGAVAVTPAHRLENSRALTWLVVLASAVFLVPYFVERGFLGLDLNIVNFTFLMVGLLLHGTPISYVRAVGDGAKAASGVIIQFPFYAGIMGVMIHSGLVAVIAGWFVTISTAGTYPFWAFISAGLVNLAVPSGGGQWAVQGPVMIEAARTLDVDVGRTIMAVAYGDQLTNMIQPFWALPLLGITGLRAGQVIGYTATLMLIMFVMMAITIVFLP
jgi:short-chain fatty acids transporter